ncbi:MAG: homocysteine S-methyltransferase family protein [Spirochaetes bacterium]|nr:homocysteine S-methyltransferase family protein [Spirochaetota bacterium]
MNFQKRLLKPYPLVMDGAMGTMLFNALPEYKGNLELLNLERPDVIALIHKKYIEAGADIIETNTFGGNALKLHEAGLDSQCEEINKAAAKIAKEVAGDKAFVAGSVGPTGTLVEPMGLTPAETVYSAFKRQITGLVAGGVDCIAIETMTDLQEARLALLAAKDVTDIPVICSMTFESNGKTVTGTDIITALATLSQMGADVVGANCSMGPDGLLELFKGAIAQLHELGVPLSVWANAGLPELIDGKAVYSLSPKRFAQLSAEFAKMGFSIIGGCCGTTPQHIQALSTSVKNILIKINNKKSYYYITSRYTNINTTTHNGLLIIGERLNPTARKQFATELKENTFTFLRNESKKQQEEGAHCLDINVGVPGIDEVALMKKAVNVLTNTVTIPLMIDSDNPAVTQAALWQYPGIPIINSISAKKQSFEAMLPLLKKFGGFVIAMCLDESGIHKDAKKRIAIGEKLIDALQQNGIALSRIFIDPLILAESAESGAAIETLKVIEHFAQMGIKTSIGLSNISFGLPQRKFINNAFLKLALQRGLYAAIVNPVAIDTNITKPFSTEEMLALDFLEGRDKNASHYIAYFGTAQQNTQQQANVVNILERIFALVVEGNIDDIELAVKEALTQYSPDTIMNDALIAALEKVGELYSKGEYFLPQMIASADTMKKGFTILKPLMMQKKESSLGTIIICTVKGDIHDIGKNIVAMMLENHGFNVIDLGKDVPNEIVIEKINEYKPDVVCLSSLLTTTMPNMGIIAKEIKTQKLPCKLMVGGAVVTKEYADSIGAFYGKDAVEAVAVAKEIVGNSK